MDNNKPNDYTAFVRTTSNVISKSNHYQISLPPHVMKKMKWKLNEKVRIKTIRGKDIQNYIMIEKEIIDD